MGQESLRVHRPKSEKMTTTRARVHDKNLKCSRRLSVTFIALLTFSLLNILLDSVSCAVVYQVRFIATNGRTDYALAGESIELSCHYIMKDEAEDIKQVIWSKDGKNFLRWRKNKPGLEVLSYTFKGHIDTFSTNSHITIHNVTIDMHGKYKCSVRTDLGTHEMEENLIVISQSSCKLSDWQADSVPSQCSELFRFDCKNMFPKPVPSCGLWNGKLEKFIRSVMVDISEESNKQTYRVRYTEKFELPKGVTTPNSKQVVPAANTSTSYPNSNNSYLQQNHNLDLLQYAGHLMFKCDIIVPDTSWRLSFIYRMFDYADSCYQSPLETIERMRLNYSHYATSRMQQAGYLVEKQVDEFEMLGSTSNLKYELLPPPPPSSLTKAINLDGKKSPPLSPKVELNCWQKPLLGTLARISCANKANHIKLTGANLFQCTPAGWVPLPESHQTDLQQASIKKYNRHRRPPRPSRRVGPSFTRGSEGQHEDETSSESSLTDMPGGSNELEEATTERITKIASTDFEIIPASSNQQSELLRPDLNDRDGWTQANLTPSQLVSLLPTCVSTRRHQTATIVSNRLPLLEETHILESSNRNPNSNGQPGNGVDKNQRNSFFNFSSSGSKSSHPQYWQPLISLLIAIIMILMVS